MKRISRNKEDGNTVVRYLKSFKHAIDGILYAAIYEHNMIIILLAIHITTLAGFYFEIKSYEWLFCITCFGMVMGTEMINSSIEAVVDLETNKYHPLAKIAKDTASGATLVFAVTSLIGSLVIFLPKIIEMIGG